jgi:hypothetical protein
MYKISFAMILKTNLLLVYYFKINKQAHAALLW